MKLKTTYWVWIVVAAMLLSISAFRWQISTWADKSDVTPDVLVTDWTRSYQLYGEPHAIWLSGDEWVGVNLRTLKFTLYEAEKRHQTPEIVVYGIPLRDMGQSSAGGFSTYADYVADNQLNAREIEQFVEKTGLHPRIYLEPDALAHAIEYRHQRHDDATSTRLYQSRTRLMRWLISLYQNAGARVYLDAAHSGWFDYDAQKIASMARALNDAGIAQADGLVSNVSNRQPVSGGYTRTEAHYLSRLLPLLPLLPNRHLDVVVDTSRNGGPTTTRTYRLAADGRMLDNEWAQGRHVGFWEKSASGEIWVIPFFGRVMKVSELVEKDHFQYDSASRILSAPPWLDAVGDVQIGAAPTDYPDTAYVSKFRYIKPPDDCDGSLNCPPGKSKHEINQRTEALQGAEPSSFISGWPLRF